jgi:hypothetical protein
MSSFDPPSYPPPTYAPTASYPATPPPVDTSGPLKPRAVWFVIGALLIAAGVAAGITLLTVGIVSTSRTVDNFGRFAAPGSATLEFKKPGTYTIYYEYESEVCPVGGGGRSCETISASHDKPRNLAITVTNSKGAKLPLRSVDNEVSFSVSGKAGEAVNRVEISTAGTYQISADAATSETFAIAVGRGVFGHLIAYILGAVGAALVLIGLGLATLIVTGVKRGRRKRERRRAAEGYGGYGPGGYGGGGYSPYGPYGGYGVPGAPPSYGTPSPSPSGGSWGQPGPSGESSGPWGPPRS